MSTVISILKAVAVVLGLLDVPRPESDSDVIDEGLAPTHSYLD